LPSGSPQQAGSEVPRPNLPRPSLFGLLLGLALAEVLGGFSKAVKARTDVRVGWLTPLLGLLVILDLTPFWITAWSLRDALPVRFWVLLVVLAHTGLYYLAATLIFPDDPHSPPDHDTQYFANRRLVLAAMLIANGPNYMLDYFRGGLDYFRGGADFISTPTSMIIAVSFLGLLVAAAFVRSRRVSGLLLCLLIALYLLAAIRDALNDAGAANSGASVSASNAP